jgi:hypothetical protein
VVDKEKAGAGARVLHRAAACAELGEQLREVGQCMLILLMKTLPIRLQAV